MNPGQATDGDWLALYGSLMRGLGAMDELGVRDALRYVGPCVLSGQLFDLGNYPGMRHGDGRIIAELYAMLDADALRDLDSFEGFSPATPRKSLYLRERIALLDPASTEAWVYVYNDVPDASTRIVEGDWRAHLTLRQAHASQGSD